METTIDRIAEDIYRISTYLPDGPPGGITFNQFLLVADEPLLFHTGTPRIFPAVRDAVTSVLSPDRIRWISSAHASRPDEYGAIVQWMDVAPHATAAHGHAGCFLCLDDVSPRPPRALADGEVIDLGGLHVQWFDTPHVPGPWEAGVLFERATRTLFCGDLFGRTGPASVITTTDIVDAAIAHDQLMHGHAITPNTGPTLRRLATLEPQRLALMHGPTYVGDGADALRRFADYFDACLLAPV
jgi:flavorubredoxin